MTFPLELSAKALWQRLDTDWNHYMDRASDAASLTIPYIAPPDSHNTGSNISALSLPTPFQSVGSRGINNLAAKFLLTLLNTPFFRLGLDKYLFAERFGADELTEAETSLVAMENSIHDEIESMGLKPAAYQGFRHMAVTGNGIIEILDEGKPKFIPLKSYRLKRDPEDNLLLLMFRMEVALSALPKNVQAAVMAADAMSGEVSADISMKPVVLYTRVQRMPNGRFSGWQELEGGQIIDGTQGAWDEEELPWIVLRWNRVDGEDYGRGIGEEVIGDLRSLEGLSQALVEGAAAASHHLWLVNPNGRTRIRDLASAPNGAFRVGNAEDVSALKLDKGADFAFASGTSQDIIRRLEHAFLLLTGVQRNAERVTAEEIRTLAQELQENLGGVFSVQAEEFQLPIVRRVMSRMEKRGALPTTPKGLVVPKIITGLEGLGRNQEANRLRVALQDIVSVYGEAGLEALEKREVVDRLLNGAGVTAEGLLKSEEDIAAEAQQQQQAALAQQVAPNVATQVGQLVQQQQAAG